MKKLFKSIVGESRTKFFLRLILMTTLLVSFGSAVAVLLTDLWWFQSMAAGSVWTTVFSTKVWLSVVSCLIALVITWINLYFVDRVSDLAPATGDTQDFLHQRYLRLVESHGPLVRFGIAAVVGVLSGAANYSQWQSWLLFSNSQSFGEVDPVLGKDASFYVFRLPFYSFVNDWLSLVLLLVLVVVTVVYLLRGSPGKQLSVQRLSNVSHLKLHLSVLLGLLILTRAVSYYLDRFSLAISDNGGFRGVMATDSTVRLPALGVMILVSLTAVVLLAVNLRRKGWSFMFIAVAMWGLSHVAIVMMFPAVHQRLRVDPIRSTRESANVEHNINATRYAYGLDKIETREFDYKPGLSDENAALARDVFDNVPIVDPRRADDEFQNNQTVRGFFGFSGPLDVDRYKIAGETRPVVLATRNLDHNLVDDTWEDRHVLNTHGYGVVVAAAYEQPDQVRGAGEEGTHPLDYKIKGLGTDETEIDDDFEENYFEAPQIYFSEGMTGYSVVGADRDEIDYQTRENTSVETRYDGRGVAMGSLFRRFAFALRFGQIDPLISGSIEPESKVLMYRDIESRVKKMAPFLKVDSDAYPVVNDGRVYWIADAYTTSDSYPFSEPARTTLRGADLSADFNYVRNSVKVVVNAYDGTMDFYVFDDSDPVLKAWRKSFKGLFKDRSEMPETLLEHVRYPRDLFAVQTDMWASYVIDDPTVFIQGDTRWSITNEPSNAPVGDEDQANALASERRPMTPLYTYNSVPGEDASTRSDDPAEAAGSDEPDVEPTLAKPEFVLQRSFAPRNRDAGDRAKHLTAVMMARSDGEHYGELISVTVPSGEVQTPDIVDTEIRKLASLTEYKKQRLGNKVDFGQMHLVFAGNNVVYVRSVYAESGGSGNIPELVRVVAATGDIKRSMGITLGGAVDGLLPVSQPVSQPSERVDDSTEQPSESSSANPQSLLQILRAVDSLMEQAKSAESQGDTATAERLRGQAESLISQSLQLVGG